MSLRRSYKRLWRWKDQLGNRDYCIEYPFRRSVCTSQSLLQRVQRGDPVNPGDSAGTYLVHGHSQKAGIAQLAVQPFFQMTPPPFNSALAPSHAQGRPLQNPIPLPPNHPPKSGQPSQPRHRVGQQELLSYFNKQRPPDTLHTPQQPPGPSNQASQGYAQNGQSRTGASNRAGGAALQQPSASINPKYETSIEGTVKTITMENKSTGYIVAKIKVEPGEGVPSSRLTRKNLMTAVGNHKQMLLGQRVRLEGHWIKHPKYGYQMQVENVIPFRMSDAEEARHMLLGAALPGVGPKTAALIAEEFGTSIESVMNSAAAAKKLSRVRGIGPKTADKIKTAWDATKGKREAALFLQRVGLTGKVVQRLVARHGNNTQAEMEKDPYYAMRNLKGMDLRKAEAVARELGLKDEEQLPSRAAMGMVDKLLDAARQGGHSFLTWEQLQAQTLAHLNAGIPWKGNDLKGIALTAAKWGDIVVELGDVRVPEFSAEAAPTCSPSRVQESLEAYLKARMKGVGPQRAQKLVNEFGEGILEVLQSPKATAEARLAGVPGLRKHAEEIKKAWDANPFSRPAWVSPNPDPKFKLLPLAQRPLADKTQRFTVPVTKETWSDAVRCYHPEIHSAEVVVARELARLASKPPFREELKRTKQWLNINEEKSGVKLSKGQRQAILVASTAPVLILTGGPGCGKTSTVAQIVKLWNAKKKDIKLAAPTGRASQRLQEVAVFESSSTIHRLLQYKAAGARPAGAVEADDEEELEGRYNFCRANPLETDAVLVDEAAMLDIQLAAALLEALHHKTQLILVGDVDQLPPVGPGTVLSAAIDSGAIPVVDLREIFRQAQESHIVRAAHNIQKGANPNFTLVDSATIQGRSYGAKLESDAVWFKPPMQHDGNHLQNLMVDALTNFIPSQGFDIHTDVQVLSPMRRGTAGVEGMNQRLQELLNPPSDKRPQIARSRQGGWFRLGDRVIQSQNNYEREVFNGDVGYVVQVDPLGKNMVVEFPETDYQKVQGGKKTKLVEYMSSSFGELEMGWATTVHKAQGGESPVVLLLLSNSHRNLLTRRLLYTAVTRAKKLVVIVSPERALDTAVTEVDGDKRHSTLKSRIMAQAARMGLTYQEAQRFGTEPAANVIDVTCTSANPSQAAAEAVPVAREPPSGPQAEPALATAPLANGTPLTAAGRTQSRPAAGAVPSTSRAETSQGRSNGYTAEAWERDGAAKASSAATDYPKSPLMAGIEEVKATTQAAAPPPPQARPSTPAPRRATVRRNGAPRRGSAVAQQGVGVGSRRRGPGVNGEQRQPPRGAPQPSGGSGQWTPSSNGAASSTGGEERQRDKISSVLLQSLQSNAPRSQRMN